MSKGLLILLICLAIQPLQSWAKADLTESITTGFGENYQDAVASALMESVRQVNGVLVGDEKTIKVEFEQLIDGHSETNLAKVDISKDIFLRSKGAIKSYLVTTVVKPTKEHPTWSVTVKALIPKYISEIGNTKLPNLAIFPFRDNKRVLKTNQARLLTGGFEISNRIRDQLINTFTKSNFFNVLNRSFERELASEKALLNSGKVPAIEARRLGQVLGADFILLGTIDDHATNTETSKLYGLENMTITERLDVSYQLVEVATQQIFWADTVSMVFEKAKEPKAEELYKSVALKVSESILDLIHPIQIMKVSTKDEIYLNQGKARVKQGEVFAIFDIGTTLKNPANDEIIQVKGAKLGILEIKTVFAKYATAQLTSGNINLVVLGSSVEKIRLEKQKHPSFDKEVRATEGSGEAPIRW